MAGSNNELTRRLRAPFQNLVGSFATRFTPMGWMNRGKRRDVAGNETAPVSEIAVAFGGGCLHGARNRKPAINGIVLLDAADNLADFHRRLFFQRGLVGARQHGQQQRRQNGDDGDDDQHFDEGEGGRGA